MKIANSRISGFVMIKKTQTYCAIIAEHVVIIYSSIFISPGQGEGRRSISQLTLPHPMKCFLCQNGTGSIFLCQNGTGSLLLGLVVSSIIS